MLKAGTVLNGRYEILKQIGKGGTSTVYLAMNQVLNQQWVIKEILSDRNSADTKRVLREARMMMKFDHPSIPRITDIIERPNATYIVMDYVSGQSLAHALKEKGPLPQAVVLEWGQQLCNILRYLHSQERPVIYHDLKPGNIILKEPEKNIKLIDFGEARYLVNGDAPGGGKTKEYAAPEQQRETRGKTDERTDIYCFGTTMYRLLCGHFPDPLPTPVGSLREKYPELKISKGMDNIIRKCTRIDPDNRFQSADELMRALENVNLWDEDYLKKQKTKIGSVVGTLVLSVVLLIGGVVFRQMAAYTNSQTYEELIATEVSVDYDTKVANYVQAIGLDGDDPRGYLKLIQAYRDNAQFGDKQSQQITTLYNAGRASFEMESEEMLELNYQLGLLYFNMYTGESDSFRARIQKSKSYFQYVVEYGTESYAHYRIANSYYVLCEFFINFVLSDVSVQEPTAADYESMIQAIDTCMADMQTYAAGDAAYTRLTLYQHILNMINTNVRGLALNGIDRAQVRGMVEDVLQAAQQESVTQSVSLSLQSKIQTDGESVLDNIEREYDNQKER